MNKDLGILLDGSRVHELSGDSGNVFAFLMSRGLTLICGKPHWSGSLCPDGLARFKDPQSILHVACPINSDALWTAETALRSGSVETVILAAYQTPDLTSFRRLQLAAEKGKSLGLLLVNNPAKSNAAETRWHCTAQPGTTPDSTLFLASCYKNKKGTLGSWMINAKGREDIVIMDAASARGPHGAAGLAHR